MYILFSSLAPQPVHFSHAGAAYRFKISVIMQIMQAPKLWVFTLIIGAIML